MYNFIVRRQPKSFNSWRNATYSSKESYKADIKTSFMQFHLEHKYLNEDLYGILYYFFKRDVKVDADNLSKPLWDCLAGFLFEDDKQVKIRTAGTFDLSKNDFNILDFSGLSGEIVIELLDAFEREEHIIYVECGYLNTSMFKFNIETNGN